MGLNIVKETLDKGIDFNLINTSKFKTNLVSIYIIRPLLKKEATMNALIPLILKRGTQKHKTALEIQRRLEELYGSNLSINVNKKGEKQIIRFTIEGPQGDFVNSDDLLREQLAMLNEIINNPLIESDSFSSEYVEQEKRNLKNRIEGRINDKKQYAVDRCIEEMCKNEKFSIYKYGFVEDIEAITPQEIFEHYRRIMITSPIHISIVGNLNKEDTIKLVKDIFTFERDDLVNITRENIIKEANTKNKIFEEMDINQGKLTLGFRTNIPYEDSLYEAFMVGSNVLGGGPNSKLFRNVREKESLAYYVYTKLYKYKSIMLVASGIEFQNYNKAFNIIKEQVKELKSGNFEEKDIAQAKNSIITSLRSMMDSSFSISEFYLSQKITNDNRTIEEIIESIRVVAKEDIVKATGKLSLDTIYFLKNKGNDEEE